MTEADIVVALLGGDFTEDEIKIRCDIGQDDLETIMKAHNCEISANCNLWSNSDDMDDDGFCEDCHKT